MRRQAVVAARSRSGDHPSPGVMRTARARYARAALSPPLMLPFSSVLPFVIESGACV